LPAANADQRISIREIRPNPLQPRVTFDPADLAELESSLKVHGLLQPVVVRKAPGGDGYELIAGERRFRAASRLGWTDIPAIIRQVDDSELLTLALIENLQRSDLDPVEEAEGYRKLIDDFGLTQQEVAEAIGKDRSTVANILRLLNLPVSVRKLLQEGALSVGHARALLGMSDQRAMAELARAIVAEGLTVRDVEKRVRDRSAKAAPSRKPGAVASKPAEARRIEEDLRRFFQTDVTVTADSAGSGSLKFAFYSADDLERLLDLMLGASRERS
jgi:ParB family transcriptional regulator, chromosome partitioning protein